MWEKLSEGHPLCLHIFLLGKFSSYEFFY
jgi:hypothetical protein